MAEAQAVEQTDADVRRDLEARHGTVYTTDEMTAAFTVHAFAAPWVVVSRKSDNVKGTLEFIHRPRFYFAFREDN